MSLSSFPRSPSAFNLLGGSPPSVARPARLTTDQRRPLDVATAAPAPAAAPTPDASVATGLPDTSVGPRPPRIPPRPTAGSVNGESPPAAPRDVVVDPLVEAPTSQEPPTYGQRTPAPSRPRRSTRGRRSSWTAWSMVALIVGAAVFATFELVGWRLAGPRSATLETVVLDAPRLHIGTTESSEVEAVEVAAGDLVEAGELLAVVILPSVDGAPREADSLLAPTDAVVVHVAQPPGSVVRAGEPVITLYDPDALEFVATAPVETVTSLDVGMTAMVEGSGLTEPIRATVRAVRVSSDGSTTPDHLSVRLQPEDPADVSGLIPDLPFTATVDLRSAPNGAPSVVTVGR